MAFSPLIVNPKVKYQTATSIAAGSSQDFHGDAVAFRKQAHLLKVIPSASVPWRAEISIVIDNVDIGTQAVLFSNDIDNGEFRKGEIFFNNDNEAFDLCYFRVRMTNMDCAKTADIYCTIIWDEENIVKC